MAYRNVANLEPVSPLEVAWCDALIDAGYDGDIPCSTDGKRLRAYFANVDRIVAERADSLRALISAHKAKEVRGTGWHYAYGLERALERAIRTPRQP